MPAISVILPVYNGDPYVAGAVESILNQTCGDFELIVIDDGSTDGSLATLTRYAERDARVRLVTRPNKGFVATLNEGLSLATADLIARMDADDVCRPDRLQKQLDLMLTHADVVLLGGGYELIDSRGRLLTTIRPPTDDTTLQSMSLAGRTPICHPLAMFRRAAVERVGGYRVEYTPADDLDLWLRLGEVGKVACLPDVILKYRQHPGSMSEAQQSKQLAGMQQAVIDAYQRRGLSETPPKVGQWRAGDDDHATRRQNLKYGWWAYHSGENVTARSYAWDVLWKNPASVEAWKLLYFAALKTSPRYVKS